MITIIRTIQSILSFGIITGYLFFVYLTLIILTVNIKFYRFYLLSLKKWTV